MEKFVTARCPGVLERIRVPAKTLKHMPNWQLVPDGAAAPKPRRRRRASAPQTPQQRPVEAPAETEKPATPADTIESPEGDLS